MMTKSLITFEVVGKEPVTDANLEQVLGDFLYGDAEAEFSIGEPEIKCEKIDALQAITIIEKHGSSPEFFGLEP